MTMFARLRPSAALSLMLLSFLLSGGCDKKSPTGPTETVTITEIVVGIGSEATAKSVAAVHYTLWLYDASKPDGKGAKLETSVGGQPFSFTLGAKQVIAGWEQGVPGMRVGGTRRVVVPPSLAYGSGGSGAVPPNATLVFEIQLLGVA